MDSCAAVPRRFANIWFGFAGEPHPRRAGVSLPNAQNLCICVKCVLQSKARVTRNHCPAHGPCDSKVLISRFYLGRSSITRVWHLEAVRRGPVPRYCCCSRTAHTHTHTHTHTHKWVEQSLEFNWGPWRQNVQPCSSGGRNGNNSTQSESLFGHQIGDKRGKGLAIFDVITTPQRCHVEE